MKKGSTKPIGATLVMAAVALVFTALACAKHEDEPSAAAPGASPPVVVANTGGAVDPARVARESRGPAEAGEFAAASSDSLPPDVSATVADTLVAPGTIVEITAEGSPDVVEVVLSDGIGKKQRFARDPAGGPWRASYRVPMKAPTDRLGLSVTARNGIDRWRRVWVFLNVDRESGKEEHESASER